jgi:hypothetical protein
MDRLSRVRRLVEFGLTRPARLHDRVGHALIQAARAESYFGVERASDAGCEGGSGRSVETGSLAGKVSANARSSRLSTCSRSAGGGRSFCWAPRCSLLRVRLLISVVRLCHGMARVYEPGSATDDSSINPLQRKDYFQLFAAKRRRRTLLVRSSSRSDHR